MIIYNKEKIKQLKKILNNDFYILTDFDGTITKGSNNSTWASIFKNEKVSDEFVQECTKIYNYYHKYELNNEIAIEEKSKIMEEWYKNNKYDCRYRHISSCHIRIVFICFTATATKSIWFRDSLIRNPPQYHLSNQRAHPTTLVGHFCVPHI